VRPCPPSRRPGVPRPAVKRRGALRGASRRQSEKRLSVYAGKRHLEKKRRLLTSNFSGRGDLGLTEATELEGKTVQRLPRSLRRMSTSNTGLRNELKKKKGILNQERSSHSANRKRKTSSGMSLKMRKRKRVKWSEKKGIAFHQHAVSAQKTPPRLPVIVLMSEKLKKRSVV